MAHHYRRMQMRIPGVHRIPTGSALLPSIEREIEFCAHKFNCSKSFVVATALQEFFGIRGDDYRQEREYEQAKAEARAIAKQENKVVRITRVA